MNKAKWFAVSKPSTGEIVATSANQIVPPKFRGPTKMLYYIQQTPLSSCRGVWGQDYVYHCPISVQLSLSIGAVILPYLGTVGRPVYYLTEQNSYYSDPMHPTFLSCRKVGKSWYIIQQFMSSCHNTYLKNGKKIFSTFFKYLHVQLLTSLAWWQPVFQGREEVW